MSRKGGIGRHISALGADIGRSLKQKTEELRDRADELYGQTAPPPGTVSIEPGFARPLIGEGWIRAEVPRKGKTKEPMPGIRYLVLSHVIVPGEEVIYTERDPHPYGITDPNVAHLKARAATDFQPYITNFALRRNVITINLRPFQSPRLPYELYDDAATCIFGVSEVPAVRLLIDQAAGEATLNNLVIPRNTPELPEGRG